MKEFWALDTDLKDYHISPIYGPMNGLPPIELFCGTKEIPYATVETLKEKVQKENGTITLHIGQDMIHVWPYFLWSKESKSAFMELLQAF